MCFLTKTGKRNEEIGEKLRLVYGDYALKKTAVDIFIVIETL